MDENRNFLGFFLISDYVMYGCEDVWFDFYCYLFLESLDIE